MKNSSTFKNETNGDNSPIITGITAENFIYQPQGDVEINQSKAKPFIEYSDDELLDYGLFLAKCLKKERSSKRKFIQKRMFGVFLVIIILFAIYVIANSLDKDKLQIGGFIVGVATLILTFAGISGYQAPNQTEKDYLADGDAIVRILNYRQNKKFANQIINAFK